MSIEADKAESRSRGGRRGADGGAGTADKKRTRGTFGSPEAEASSHRRPLGLECPEQPLTAVSVSWP